MQFELIREAIERRRFQPGQVKFSTSSFDDPHIKDIIAALAVSFNKTPQNVINYVQVKVNKTMDLAKKAPLLYGTIQKNLIEGELFRLLEKSKLETNAPKFSVKTFFKLQRAIAAENDEFWPLRSFLDPRRLNPRFELLDKGNKLKVTTAAASPSGVFYFNTAFMQKLMDYAHLKQLKPKGLKYVSNGGDIPDEYAYIEFVIMHEFMHYSHGDFYYQNIIPNAKPKIINWVGDFVSNYLLVKSGFEQLPIGLYSDDINYDRQKKYVDMYNLVLSEFKKLTPEQKKRLDAAMKNQSDDHEPGQQEGKEQKGEEGESKQPPPEETPPEETPPEETPPEETPPEETSPEDELNTDGDEENLIPVKVGDVVRNDETGQYGRVVGITADGPEIEPVSADEIRNEYPDVGA